MKKIILSVAIIALSVMATSKSANAQEGFYIGIEGTPQISWMMNETDRNDSRFDYRSTANGSFGISTQYNYTDNMGIGLNVLYSMQGQRYTIEGFDRYKRVDYIKIPLMYVYNYELTTDLNFIGRIGPQLSLLTNARIVDDDGNNIISDHKAAYQNATFGGVVTAGINTKINANWFFDISLRFDYDFTNAERSGYITEFNGPIIGNGNGNGNGTAFNVNRSNTYNSTLGLNVGLRYMLPE